MVMRKIFLLIIIVNLITSCDIQVTDDGFLSFSMNSDISMKNKVFLVHYDVQPNYVTTIEGEKLRIAEAFIEYKYNIKHSGEVIKWRGTQMILRLRDKIPNNYNLDWELDNDYHFTRGTGDYMLHTDMLCSPVEKTNTIWSCLNRLDTIDVQIKRIDVKDSLKAIIGNLKFIKRK